MSYKKALEILKSLPPEQQLLACGTYKFFDRDGKAVCGCAVGKILPNFYNNLKQLDSMLGLGIEELWDSSGEGKDPILTQDLRDAELTYDELDDLQTVNDTYLGRTSGYKDEKYFCLPEDNSESARKARYKHVVQWMEKKIANQLELW